MASSRLRAVAALVVALALFQVVFEDVVVFFAASGTGPEVLATPAVMVAVPLLVASVLLAVLVGGALLNADTLR